MISNVSQKLKKLMKIGVVADSDDSASYPVVFLNYLGKLRSRAVNFSPFGVWGRPTDGAMAVALNINGNESNKFALTNELKSRPIKNLNKGEVVLGNLLSYLHFKEDGSISLFINKTETLTIDASGNVALTGNLDITGDVTITGDLDVTGAITATGIVEGSNLTNGSVPYTTHVHSNPEGGNTGVPI